MDFIISTDSTCDLSANELEQMGAEVVSLSYSVNGKEYGNDSKINLTIKEYYDAMRQGSKTSTSRITTNQAFEYFSSLLLKKKDILHISFSSALSGTYESVKAVADELNIQSENKIVVIDSKCACLGEGLLVSLVCSYAKSHTFEQTIEYAEKTKDKIVHLFTVNDLKYLCAGGRVSKAAAMVGSMLKIKPALCVDETGRLVPKAKCIGRKCSLNKLIDKTIEHYTGESEKVIVAHADCREDAEYIAKALQEKLGVSVQIGEIGFVIGSHSGPGTIAVFFVGENRIF